MSENQLPIIGITIGDPSGIGPEISIKSLLNESIYEKCKPILIGDSFVVDRYLNKFNIELKTRDIYSVSDAEFEFGVIDIINLNIINSCNFEPNIISGISGNASFKYVIKSIELALKGEIDAVVTGPIHKQALHLGGHKFSGHTEIFAEFTGTSSYGMLLINDDFRILHTSTHVSLRDACDLVKKERILECIILLDKCLQDLKLKRRKIGVSGLNPHASDFGLFGSEEELEIEPAIRVAKERGYNVEGPFPPDTFFARAYSGEFDGCIAMYHDQGHIPFKMLGFKWRNGKMIELNGVNITLGLPIIRTSVDHGTALDIAWKNFANPTAMLAAINYASALAISSNK